MSGCLKRIFQLLIAFVVLIALFITFYIGIPIQGWMSREARVTAPIPITPMWALEPWVWEDDVNTGAFVQELLDGYKQHDIPARTILIDSPWSTRYNDFIVDEARYPNPKEFFTKLQDDGYRVVLWMTSSVNHTSKDTALPESRDWFEEAKAKGYLMNNGVDTRWWKGAGGFIDYRNPEAMKWWRGLQQDVFDFGLDGWKLDGAEVYALNKWGAIPTPWLKSHEGTITLRDYTDDYYNEEYKHGLTQNPEFITLARSVDNGPIEEARQGLLRELPEFMAGLPFPSPHPDGFAPRQSAPVTWVGDNDHAWVEEEEGIEEALRDILEAARKGYGVIGSDVGGYSGKEFPPNVYIRWAQFSTFCGLFLNGGHGERRLWLRTPQELELIREAAWLHSELVPYIYSAIVEQHSGGPVLMRPMDVDFQYEFGPAFFVAPIFEDKLERTVTLPEGKWRYWYDDSELITSPSVLTRSFPMDEFPVFVREGSIIPMKISRDYTGIGQRDWESFTTFSIYPHGAEFTEESSTTLHREGAGPVTVRVRNKEAATEITLSGEPLAHILRLRADAAPQGVSLNGQALPVDQWSYDAASKKIVIKRTLELDQPLGTGERVYRIN
jgi:alpha-glucosidase (family GH31 glycosyl hydrolase)